uniref:Uncharacterized protein n=1 Tax=Arundo donax TaxID=35708 RepID=A0A0A9CQD7_ARUDO
MKTRTEKERRKKAKQDATAQGMHKSEDI